MSKDNSAKQQIYDQLITYNLDPELLDNKGKTITSADDADIFSFDFTTNNNNYGTVVIAFNDDQSLEVYFGDNLGRTMEETDRQDWYDFLYMLRMIAKRNLLTFGLKNLSRLKYTMQSMAALKESIFEGYYGTRKVSYSDQPQKTRLIIKHNKTLGEADARFRYIESLFVETSDGERFKLPFTKLSGGRAMARHVAEGGRPYDAFGQHIGKLVEDINVLSRFSRANQGKTFEGSAGQLVSDAMSHYTGLKKKIKALASRRGYHAYKEAWVPEDLEEQDYDVEGIKRLFVEQNIDQRIESALPLLAQLESSHSEVTEGDIVKHKFAVKQAQQAKDKYQYSQDVADSIPKFDPKAKRNVTPDLFKGNEEPYDYFYSKHIRDNVAQVIGVTADGQHVNTGTTRSDVADALADAYNRGGFSDQEIKKVPMKEVDNFDSWASTVVEGTWSIPDTKEKISQLLTFMSKEQPLGPDAVNATEQLYELIGDDELFDWLGDAAEADPEADARQVVLDWIKEKQYKPEWQDILAPLVSKLDTESTLHNNTKGSNMKSKEITGEGLVLTRKIGEPIKMPGEKGTGAMIQMDPLTRSKGIGPTNVPGQKYTSKDPGWTIKQAQQERDIADLKAMDNTPDPQTFSISFDDDGNPITDSVDPLVQLKHASGLKESPLATKALSSIAHNIAQGIPRPNPKTPPTAPKATQPSPDNRNTPDTPKTTPYTNPNDPAMWSGKSLAPIAHDEPVRYPDFGVRSNPLQYDDEIQTNVPGQQYTGSLADMNMISRHEQDIEDLKRMPKPPTYSIKYDDNGKVLPAKQAEQVDPLVQLKHASGLKEAPIVPGEQTTTSAPAPASMQKPAPKDEITPSQLADFEKAFRDSNPQVPGQRYVGTKDYMDNLKQHDAAIRAMRTDMALDASHRQAMTYDDQGERAPIPQLVPPKDQTESANPALARIMKLAGK